MAIATSDYAGGWGFLGIVTPLFGQWQSFSSPTQSGNSLIRLTFYGNAQNVRSYGHIRAVYDTGDLIESPWQRIYFSDRPILIDLKTPEQFLYNAQAVPRFFEIKKELKRYYRSRFGATTDDPWSVGLEVLEQAALPASVLNALQGSPAKVFNVGNSGNIIVVLESQEP